jgi:hypothetical protein
MTEVNETILEKIRKVQGYLKSDNANEAAVAAAKLTEMLLKYNLSLEDIPEEQRKADPFGRSYTDQESNRLADWRITLANSIARANLCRVVISGSSLQWLGRESNLQVAQYIYETCANDLQRICDGLWYAIADLIKDMPKEERIHGKTWKADFLAGAAVGVQQKLREETETWRNSAPNANALITTNDSELALYMRQIFPAGLGHRSGPTVAGGNAYGLGVKTGRNVSFKTGVGAGGSSGPRQIRG